MQRSYRSLCYVLYNIVRRMYGTDEDYMQNTQGVKLFNEF